MYKVQQSTQNPRARQARLGFTILTIATIFATCFFMTQAIMTAVYGYDDDLKANGSAHIGLGAGAPPTTALVNPIDDYVHNIKGEICPTLLLLHNNNNNTTAESECMNL